MPISTALVSSLKCLENIFDVAFLSMHWVFSKYGNDIAERNCRTLKEVDDWVFCCFGTT